MIDHYAVYLLTVLLIKTVNGQKTVHIVDINTVSILMTSDDLCNIVEKDFQHTFVYLQNIVSPATNRKLSHLTSDVT